MGFIVDINILCIAHIAHVPDVPFCLYIRFGYLAHGITTDVDRISVCGRCCRCRKGSSLCVCGRVVPRPDGETNGYRP